MNAKELLRRISLVFIGLVCASQIAVASDSDSGTLTPGKTSSCVTIPPSGPTIYLVEIGFISGSIGTYSPTGLTGGEAVNALVDDGEQVGGCGPVSPSTSLLGVKGFSSNPGSSWLISVTCNGVEKLSSVASFNYVSGTDYATWTWSSVFGFVDNEQVSCTIVHN